MIKKFNFTQFDNELVISKEEQITENEVVELEVTYTQSQLEQYIEDNTIKIEQEAYQRGYQDRNKEIDIEQNEKERNIENIILQILDKVSHYNFADIKNQIRQEYFNDMINVVYLIFKKITYQEIKKETLDIICKSAEDILNKFDEPTNFQIILHPNINIEIQEKIRKILESNNIQHNIKYKSDDNISIDSCHIEHNNTRINFNLDNIFIQIDDIIKNITMLH